MLNPQNLSNGNEQYEKFYSTIGKKYKMQYDYRHTNGKLFSTVKNTLEECRQAKENWLNKI